jgi:hypothetical protein
MSLLVYSPNCPHSIDILEYVKNNPQLKQVVKFDNINTHGIPYNYKSSITRVPTMLTNFDRMAVPSEFCKNILTRQFPEKEFYVIHAYIPPAPYIFYHIGNILDPRKNFRKILEAFIRLNKPDTRLLVKST